MNFDLYAYMPCFMHIYGCFHRICCLTSAHTSIHKGIHEREAAQSAAPFMDGCVWACEAADAMETSINMHETCASIHITRNPCGFDISYLFIPDLFPLIQDCSRLIQAYSGLMQTYFGFIQAYFSLIPGLFKLVPG